MVRTAFTGAPPAGWYSVYVGSRAEREVLTAAGRELSISNPRKVLFPQAGHTKLDLVRYYLAVADGALRAAGGRPRLESSGCGDSRVAIEGPGR